MARTGQDRLLEWTGLPLALYALIHVGAYAGALFGATSFGVAESSDWRLLALELVCVWLPLSVHTARGVWQSFSALPTDATERRSALLLRLSGAATLLFAGLHVVYLRWPLWRGERDTSDVEQLLASELSATSAGVPLFAAIHVLGLGAVAAHLWIGLERFLLRRHALGERAARTLSRTLALLVFAFGCTTLVHFATGSAFPRFLR